MNFKIRKSKANAIIRSKLTTTLDKSILDDLHEIKRATRRPINQIIEVAIKEHFQSQETFDDFIDKVYAYKG